MAADQFLAGELDVPVSRDKDKMERRHHLNCLRPWLSKLAAKSDWYEFSKEVRFFPLQFRNRNQEILFKGVVGENVSRNLNLICSIGTTLTVLIWVIFGVSLGMNALGPYKKKEIILFNVMWFLITLVFLSYILYRRLKKHSAEFWLYVTFGLVTTFEIAWKLFVTVSLDMPDSLNTQADLEQAWKELENRMWLNEPQNVVDMFLLLVLDILCTTRTKWTILLHIYMGTLNTATWVFQYVQFRDYIHYQGVLYVNYLFYLLLLLGGIVVRYFAELQDRARHLKKEKNDTVLREVRNRIMNVHKKRNLAGFEKMINALVQARGLIQGISIVTQLPDAADADRLLAVTENILEHPELLYFRQKDDQITVEEAHIQEYFNMKDVFDADTSQGGDGIKTSRGGMRPSRTSMRHSRTGRRAGTSSGGLLMDQLSYSQELPGVAVDDFVPPTLKAGSAYLRQCGHVWSLSILEMATQTNAILYEVGMTLLRPFAGDLFIGEQTIAMFLIALERCYLRNPYHNALHAASVAHMVACVSRMFDMSNSTVSDGVTQATALIAALGHDAAHPARNNAFFVNCIHPIAVSYNDVSVLENFHACVTFATLEKPGCNVFESLLSDDFRVVRSEIIECILATDMRHHFESLSRFRIRREAKDYDPVTNTDDMWLVIKACLKAADLGHAALPWKQHLEFSLRVSEEFYQQGDAEQEMGFPISALCDRGSHPNFAKSQKGFIEFVAQPLFIELGEAFSSLIYKSDVQDPVEANRIAWEKHAEAGTIMEIPPSIRNIKPDLTGFNMQLHQIYGGFANKIRPTTCSEKATQTYLPGITVMRTPSFENLSSNASPYDQLPAVTHSAIFTLPK